jgi:hypothetical protein
MVRFTALNLLLSQTGPNIPQRRHSHSGFFDLRETKYWEEQKRRKMQRQAMNLAYLYA